MGSLAYQGFGDLYKSQQFERMNYSKSVQYYKISADMGLASSQLQYGLALYVGRGIDRNKAEVINDIKKSAAGGNKFAEKILPVLPNEQLFHSLQKRLLECDYKKC